MGRVRAVPRLRGLYPGVCLTTEESHCNDEFSPLLNPAVYCEDVGGSAGKSLCILNPLFAINYHYFFKTLNCKVGDHCMIIEGSRTLCGTF